MVTSPAVITSKMAQKHFQDIKVKHDDLLINMGLHQMKLEAMRQLKDVEAKEQEQNDKTIKSEENSEGENNKLGMMKIQLEADRMKLEADKHKLEMEHKKAELGVKEKEIQMKPKAK